MKKITPFSNATEAWWWLDRNCEICRRSNCSAKLAIQKGFITGDITERMASFIGYSYYHDEFDSLNPKCDHFTTVRISPTKKPKEELTPKLF